MTIKQATDTFDSRYPCSYTYEDKVRWLSGLDMRIARELLIPFGIFDKDFSGYEASASPDTPLLVPHPFDEMYILYLIMQTDLFNGETQRYNNDILAFMSVYNDFCAYVSRNGKQKSRSVHVSM
ncbi:MAG: hypothetical protein E7315_00520 [Clostridiales bacterium]|nr:hypothetical protein [Clostridiales bacterium]